MNQTARFLKVGLVQSLNRMVEIDQRLRGNGFPQSAQPMNPREKQLALEQIIDRRLDAEVAGRVK